MSAISAEDCRWLDAAVRIARPFLGTTGASPTVAALIVDPVSQLVFARAVTAAGGKLHAEGLAIAEARNLARSRTLYLTLEPTARWGRAPPGTDAIIAAGFRRVVIGIADPDRQTSGSGIAKLKKAGIETVLAEHQPSRLLHEGFIARKRLDRPFVTGTLAVSRDGMIGWRHKGGVPFTDAAAIRWLDMERALSDAVMVGAASAEIDNPSLTVRLKGLEHRVHLRLVLVGARPFDTSIGLIAAVSGYPVALIATPDRRFQLPPGVPVIAIEGKAGRPNLRLALKALADRGISGLLVEGGAKLTEALIAGEMLDRLHVISSDVEVGAKGVPAALLGSLQDRLRAARFYEVDRRALGADKLATFEPV